MQQKKRELDVDIHAQWNPCLNEKGMDMFSPSLELPIKEGFRLAFLEGKK